MKVPHVQIEILFPIQPQNFLHHQANGGRQGMPAYIYYTLANPGSLSKSERQRRAREIVVASGADTEEYFQKVVKKKGGGITFREQAKRWFNHVQNRRRKPIALSTLELWEGCLNN